MADEWTECNEVEAVVNEGVTTDASAMTAWPRRPARLGHAVVATLAGQVVSGALPEGAALPPEPVLGETFGVSRSVIRESLKVLEEKSLVVVRQGYGTTVQGRDQWQLLDPLVLKAVIEFDSTLAIFDDLIEVRATLESQMARRAANRLTEAQLNELKAYLDHLDGLIPDPMEYGRAELAYHDAITRFSGNQLARRGLAHAGGFRNDQQVLCRHPPHPDRQRDLAPGSRRHLRAAPRSRPRRGGTGGRGTHPWGLGKVQETAGLQRALGPDLSVNSRRAFSGRRKPFGTPPLGPRNWHLFRLQFL